MPAAANPCGLRSASLSHRWTVLLLIERAKLNWVAARDSCRIAQCVWTPDSSAPGLHAIERTSCGSSGGKGGRPPGSALIDRAVRTVPGKALAPLTDSMRSPADTSRDRLGTQASYSQQHALRS